MPGFLCHSRSSDSIALEQTAAMQDIEELTVAEKTHVSPVEGPPRAERPAASFPFSFQSTRTSAPSDTIPPISRNIAKISTASRADGEKFAVFRDRDEQALESTKGAVQRTLPSSAAPVQTPMKEERQGMRLERKRSHLHPYEKIRLEYDTSGDNRSGSAIIEQLQTLAAERAKLLGRLHEIQKQETEILEQLKRANTIQPILPLAQNPSSSESSRPPKASPRLQATTSPSKVPRKQPTKMPWNPELTRAFSAPSRQMPSSPPRYAPNMFRRPVLDSNKDGMPKMATSTSTTAQQRMDDGFDTTVRDDTLNARSDTGAMRQTKTSRLPTKSGDNFEPLPSKSALPRSLPGTPRKQTNTRSTSSSRGRGASKSRSRSRSRGRATATPTVTPDVERAYNVPHMGARKMWDF